MTTKNTEKSQSAAREASLSAPAGSPMERFGREILDDLYDSGEGIDEAEFQEKWLMRAERLGLLSREPAAQDSEYSWLWIRNYIDSGEPDRRRLKADGEMANVEARCAGDSNQSTTPKT
jgi:hypothetical protein